MKYIIITVSFLLGITSLQAQLTAQRTVFSTQGDFVSSGTISFSTTMGESLVGTVTNSSNMISFLQGFQVPDDATVSIDADLGNNMQVSVFPNPVQSELYLQFEGVFTQALEVQLFDAQGKRIPGWNLQVRQASLINKDVSALASGTYFLRLVQLDGRMLRSIPIIKL